MAKSKYKIYRPFRRRLNGYLNPFNIASTILIWSIYITIDVIKVTYRVIVYDIKWVYNYFHYRNIDYSCKDIENMIKNMNPREFEIFIAELYKRLGYEVEVTPKTCDGGKDIILTDYDTDETIYVECKHYSETNYVGREICQKLLGAMVMDKIDRGIIVTTGTFHKNAWDVLFKVDNLEFVDMKGIMGMVRKIEVHELPRVFMKTLQLGI